MADSPIAILPARGGSQRIPRKNIRALSGRPLLAWAIELCQSSGLFADVIVSTDDAEIAEVARAAGASVPFLRPPELADHVTPTVDVIAHAVESLTASGRAVDVVCCMYPASVFLAPDDLRGSLDLLGASTAPYVATVCRYPYPIQRALTMDNGGHLAFVDPASADSRSQDLPERWHDAGQFYWGRADAWAARLPILANAAGYEVPASRVVDIDTEDDWQRAEALHALLIGPPGRPDND